MPGLSGTGPMGKGPKTGRGLGPCKSSAKSGFISGSPRGRGLGRRGMGLGHRRRFAPSFGFGRGFGPK
jgi:hypothetical protein